MSTQRWYGTENIFPIDVGNCTWYAYGRFAEIANQWVPALGGINQHHNAGDWWAETTLLPKGQTPKVGACICWGPTVEGLGHVAIVEKVYPNGDIDISESGWESFYFYYRERLTASSNYHIPYHSGTYVFQGFIYNPYADGGGGLPIPPGTVWHGSTVPGYTYADTSQEAIDNALLIYQILNGLGWGTESCAAVIGNFHRECGLNPLLWEGGYTIPTYAEALQLSGQPGYGLPQFTPARVYLVGGQSYPGYNPHTADLAGAPIDGQAQTMFMDYHLPNDWMCDSWHYNYYSSLSDFVDISAIYPMTADQFKAGIGYSLDELFTAYVMWYLRPLASAAYSSWQSGYDSALYWYDIISQYDPNARRKRKKMPVWMMIRYF